MKENSKKGLHIGVVVDNDFFSDVRVTKEVDILLNEGYRVFVLCFSFNKGNKKRYKEANVAAVHMKKRMKDIMFFFMNLLPVYELFWKGKIKKFIKKNKIDVVHAHDLYMSRAAYKAIHVVKMNIPLILDLHENFPVSIKTYNWTKGFLRKLISRPELWRKKERKYLNYASKIIVLSQDFKELLLRRYKELTKNDLIVYKNVIDFARFRQFEKSGVKISKKKNTPYMLYFGAVAERRGVFLAFDVLKDVLLKGYEITLLIIGPVDKADRKEFQNYIHDETIKDYIEYIPWIELSELISYMEIADFCLAPFEVNPQHESGIANKIFQYMFGGKPIIASDCKPHAELIKNGHFGIIFSNKKEFTDAVIYLIENKDIAKEFGNNARHVLMNEFNEEKSNSSLVHLYKTLFIQMKSNH